MKAQHTLGIAIFLSALVPAIASAQSLAPAQPPSEDPPDAVETPSHQRLIAIGTRYSFRGGDYLEGGLGGHIRLQVHPWVTVELFTDQFAGVMNGLFRHDHEIGGTLQINVIRSHRLEIFPFLGACASLAVLNAPQGGNSATDIRAGARGGVGGVVNIRYGLSLEVLAEAITYIGHPLEAYSWTAMIGPGLTTETVGQLTVAVNYAF